MNLTDRPSDLDLEDLTKEVITEEQTPPQFHLREVLDALKKAAFDDKIKGVFIEGGLFKWLWLWLRSRKGVRKIIRRF